MGNIEERILSQMRNEKCEGYSVFSLKFLSKSGIVSAEIDVKEQGKTRRVNREFSHCKSIFG